jgi:uncharacterized coiled-coil DUF342 family protein
MSPEDVKYFKNKLDQVIKVQDFMTDIGLSKPDSDEYRVNNHYISVLQNEIEHLMSQFQDHDTGHLRTAVSVLENRVKELRKELRLKL